jgi:hypothetical protein
MQSSLCLAERTLGGVTNGGKIEHDNSVETPEKQEFLLD